MEALEMKQWIALVPHFSHIDVFVPTFFFVFHI